MRHLRDQAWVDFKDFVSAGVIELPRPMVRGFIGIDFSSDYVEYVTIKALCGPWGRYPV